jgi:hypothetical protein
MAVETGVHLVRFKSGDGEWQVNGDYHLTVGSNTLIMEAQYLDDPTPTDPNDRPVLVVAAATVLERYARWKKRFWKAVLDLF